MTDPYERLAALGLSLPPAPAPLAAYVPVAVGAGLAFTSGQLPVRDGRPTVIGLVGEDVTVEQAREAAHLCALNALAALHTFCIGEPGGLAAVLRVLKVVGFVACRLGFAGQPAVVDGASTLLADVFGDAGRSARSAVGVASLPLGVPVEVEVTVALR